MSYGESLLANGEVVLYRARQHWLAPLSDALRPIVLILLGLVAFFLSIYLGGIRQILLIVALALLLVGGVWTAVVYFTWRAQEYLITNRRVLKIEGLFDKKSGDSSLDKINDAVLSQGIVARIFKYGNLDILTAAETEIDHYEMLARAVDFKKAMLDSKHKLEYGGSGGRVAGGRAAANAGITDDVEGALDRLATLRDKGKITQADYERKKAEILDKM